MVSIKRCKIIIILKKINNNKARILLDLEIIRNYINIVFVK